jgi:hypothetical protein
MPDMWMNTDIALSEVPVNILPLIDDTDFKSREESIVYNQAGMDLVWEFTDTAGNTTQTAVTPTTAGVHDWTNQGNGMYTLEIPDTGGTINNDAEGFGQFIGFATGVLPWRGPVIGFRAAALNNALIDGGDNLDVNVVEISGDVSAADNLEATYDGTGYTNDEAPSKQSQLASLANVGSAVHRPAASYTLTVGTQSANTFAATEALDAIRHEHTGVTAMDLYYKFNIGSGTPSSVQITGYITGNNDDLDVYGYDWVAAGWVQIGNIQGSNSTANAVNSFDMFVDMVGSGANFGVVRVRLFKTSGLTSALLAIDQIFVAFNQGVSGYEGGAVWLDSSLSNTNTVVGVDGTATNPVSTMGAVNTLLAATNLKIVQVAPGSTATLAASQINQVFRGHNWNLELGGQDVSGTHFFGAVISGVGIGTSEIDFHECTFNTCTLDPFHATGCAFNEIIMTFGKAGTYIIHNSHSTVAGANTPIIDTGAAIANVDLSISDWANGMEIRNLNNAGADLFSISGHGQIIYAASSSGAVHQRGDWKVTNTGGVTITEDDNTANTNSILADTNDLQTSQGDWLTATGFSTHSAADIWAVAVRLLTAGTNIVLAKGTGLTGLNDLSAAQVNAECDTALTDYGANTVTPPTAVQNRAEMDSNSTKLIAIVGDTNELQTNQGDWLTAVGFSTHSVSDILTTQMTEAYAVDGVAPTLAQMQFMMWSFFTQMAVVTTTGTAKKLDGSTSAMTFTFNDASDPTSITRAT